MPKSCALEMIMNLAICVILVNSNYFKDCLRSSRSLLNTASTPSTAVRGDTFKQIIYGRIHSFVFLFIVTIKGLNFLPLFFCILSTHYLIISSLFLNITDVDRGMKNNITHIY